MAILTKAVLRAAIDSVFASGQLITAEQARGEFHDWIDSLLAPASIVNGAGITVSTDADGNVTVEAGGAAAAMGLPSFLANTNRDQPTDGTLVIDVTGRTDPPPRPSIVYFQTPTVLNRAADPLALLLSGDTDTRRVILDQFGNGVFARNLTPGTWYTVLATPANRYEFAEPIPVRPQDFDVVCGWISTAEAGWTDEDIALANTATTDEVVIPDKPPTTGSPTTGALLVGIPADARRVVDVIRVGQGLGPPSIDTAPRDLTDNPPNFTAAYQGEPYRWYALTGLAFAGFVGETIRVTFGDYA